MGRPKGSTKEKIAKRKTKRALTVNDIPKLIKEWDLKSIDDLANDFATSKQTILTMAKTIHKNDNSLCKPKPKKTRTRENIAKEGIALYKKEMGKK
jgi:hypothetical protein